MKLYYVKAVDDTTGENADLYVWAVTPGQAAWLYKVHWHKLSGGEIDDTRIDWVDDVPTGNPVAPTVVQWESVVRHEILTGEPE